VHVPTEEKELKKEAFYQKVEEIYDSCPLNDIKLCWGNGTPKWEEEKSTNE